MCILEASFSMFFFDVSVILPTRDGEDAREVVTAGGVKVGDSNSSEPTPASRSWPRIIYSCKQQRKQVTSQRIASHPFPMPHTVTDLKSLRFRIRVRGTTKRAASLNRFRDWL